MQYSSLKKKIQRDSNDFWRRKFTLKVRFWHFLMNCHLVEFTKYNHGFFEYVNFWFLGPRGQTACYEKSKYSLILVNVPLSVNMICINNVFYATTMTSETVICVARGYLILKKILLGNGLKSYINHIFHGTITIYPETFIIINIKKKNFVKM